MSTAQSGSSKNGNNKSKQQRGGFVLGLIVGLLLGLAVALGVALYIAKVPIPFIDKVPQRTAEQDAAEAQRNKNWDPNAPLAGKAGAKAASGVVSGAPAPAPAVVVPTAPAPAAMTTPAPAPAASTAATPAAKPADKAAEKAAEKAADKAPADKKAEAKAAAASAAAAAADPNLYFVQAGAYVKNEDAEQQRARLALLGFSAKVMEKEQSGRTVFRVRIGPIDSRDEAEGMQRKIEAAGIEANLVGVKR